MAHSTDNQTRTILSNTILHHTSDLHGLLKGFTTNDIAVVSFSFNSKHAATSTTTAYGAISANVCTADLLASLCHYVDFDRLVFDHVLADLADLQGAIDFYVQNTQ